MILPEKFFLFKTAFIISLFLNPLKASGDMISNVKVLNCIDGDTCTIKLPPGFEVRVRLACVDSPEISKGSYPGQKFSTEAKNFINSLIKNKKVDIKQVDTDRYLRPVVFVFMNGRNINYSLLENGFAEAYRGKTPYSKIDCFRIELTARSMKKGIWSLKNRESPWKFRKRHKNKTRISNS